MQCKKVPIPSHFSKDMFTIAAFDNFDHQARSSPISKNSNRDIVSKFSQVKQLKSYLSLKTVLDSASLVLPIRKIITFKEVK